ncbi:A/G-specific adenine glycosylase [Novosphingobium panipatense]|uniref:Adenine DNA glycosylase n=1 Tax=Novosphingobium panipatense TaxID=428991 RepID=A0ABY1QJ59_9SPHN|nr:A/G-specific adenine glycosylase [Novosphingobium panipatense]SMP69874.1 A/G-specific DNA-adenine glycosylase [Novosphingobium panipatense]
MDASSDTAIATLLLDWYDIHARSLPWRAPPGTPAPDPYRVWLSEVMLQQTTVAAVKDYFAAFTTRWPDVAALASAPDEDVMAAWAGLGYYARARNLLACAREVAASGGRFPDTEEGLRALPGLGAYTAAAVAAIAFGRRAVVVDANVERVVSRLSAIDTPIPAARPLIRQKADAITPDGRSGDFAQAMMDLGATVCTPRNPRCLLCPLAAGCAARTMGDPGRYPVKAPKTSKPVRQGRAFWIERDCGAAGTEVWLVRRPATGMLGGMRALPDDGWNARADGSGGEPLKGLWRTAGRVGHVFSHFALELEVALHCGTRVQAMGEGEWWPLERLDEAGLPTVFAKAARLALGQKEDA